MELVLNKIIYVMIINLQKNLGQELMELFIKLKEEIQEIEEQ